MKNYLYLLILIPVVLIYLFMSYNQTNFADIEQYVAIKDVSIVNDDHDFLIDVQFINNSEYGIELCSYSAAGVELVYLPTLYLNNKLVEITSPNVPIFIPAKSFINVKFLLNKNKRKFFQSHNTIDFSYGIQTWRSMGKTYTIPGKSIWLNYKNEY